MAKNFEEHMGKKKRTLKWGRVILFLIFGSAVLAALGWGAYHIYLTGRDAYQGCSTFFADFQTRKTTQAKFQQAKFDSYTNVLLLGVDDGDPQNPLAGRRSDTMIFISINNSDGFIHCLSIPGDTKVSIPGRQPEHKIKHAYYYGGTQLAVRTVEELLQVPIDHYIVIDTKVLIELVDIFGGLDLYVASDMDYEDPYAGFEIHLKKGYQHLGGNEAAQYVRYCSDELGDVGRVQRQQKFVKRLYDQALCIETFIKLPELADLISRRVTTSMAALDTAKLAQHLGEANPQQMKTSMLPGAFAAVNGATYWTPNPVKLEALLDEMFQVPAGIAPETAIPAQK